MNTMAALKIHAVQDVWCIESSVMIYGCNFYDTEAVRCVAQEFFSGSHAASHLSLGQ